MLFAFIPCDSNNALHCKQEYNKSGAAEINAASFIRQIDSQTNDPP